MPGEQTISFKDMCARFDVTPRTLRYYEYIELLNPRKEGRARFYGPREIARMTLILRGRRFGFSLEEIRQLLDLWEGGKGRTRQLAKTVEIAEAHLSEMKERRAELEPGDSRSRVRDAGGPRDGRVRLDLALVRHLGTTEECLHLRLEVLPAALGEPSDRHREHVVDRGIRQLE